MLDRHENLRKRALDLAAAAHALNCASLRADAPFSVAFLTDARRIADPAEIVDALPAGAAVILRDYDDPVRAERADRLCARARRRGLRFYAAGDSALAEAIGADGVHLPGAMLRGSLRAPRGMLLSASCHDAAELARAAAIGADSAFLSPAFATRSHPSARALGAEAFRALAAGAELPVIALGGITAANAGRLAGRNVCGLGAIGAFLPASDADIGP